MGSTEKAVDKGRIWNRCQPGTGRGVVKEICENGDFVGNSLLKAPICCTLVSVVGINGTYGSISGVGGGGCSRKFRERVGRIDARCEGAELVTQEVVISGLSLGCQVLRVGGQDEEHALCSGRAKDGRNLDAG